VVQEFLIIVGITYKKKVLHCPTLQHCYDSFIVLMNNQNFLVEPRNLILCLIPKNYAYFFVVMATLSEVSSKLFTIQLEYKLH